MFESKYEKRGLFKFPAYTGLRIMMMPVVIGEPSSLPDKYDDWRRAFRELSDFAFEHEGRVGYLTIDECRVGTGETQRRPGMHVDGVGGWGGGGSWGGGSGARGGTGMIVAASCNGTRVWSQSFDGEPGRDGDCEHLRSQLSGSGETLKPGVAYWCGHLCVHEAVPASAPGPRQFVRLSLPSNAPWFHGYTCNPLVRPTGPIFPSRAEMGYRPSVR